MKIEKGIPASEDLTKYIKQLEQEGLVKRTTWYRLDIGFYIVKDDAVVIKRMDLKEE